MVGDFLKMKVLMTPIDMIAWFTKDGIPNPLRFRYPISNQPDIVVKIDKVLTRTEEKFAGSRIIVFRCQSLLEETTKIFELKYELSTCKWFLSKI